MTEVRSAVRSHAEGLLMLGGAFWHFTALKEQKFYTSCTLSRALMWSSVSSIGDL